MWWVIPWSLAIVVSATLGLIFGYFMARVKCSDCEVKEEPKDGFLNAEWDELKGLELSQWEARI